MTNPAAGSTSGVIATLKVVAILAILAAALLGILMVFGAVKFDDIGPLAAKLGIMTVILAVAAAAIGLLSKSSAR